MIFIELPERILSSLASSEFVAKLGGKLELFAFYGLVELLLQRWPDPVLLAQRVSKLGQLHDHFIRLELLFCFVFDEDIADLFEAIFECKNRLFCVDFIQGCHRGGLGSMEHHKGTVLFVAHRPFFVG